MKDIVVRSLKQRALFACGEINLFFSSAECSPQVNILGILTQGLMGRNIDQSPLHALFK